MIAPRPSVALSRAVVTGLLSRIPGLYAFWDKRRPIGNTGSARYCRDIWALHRDLAAAALGADTFRPRAIAELGPGRSLGVCVAALLDNVSEATALDAGRYADAAETARTFRDLAAIMPEHDPARLAEIDAAVRALDRAPGISPLFYRAPWTDPTVCAESSLDLILSHSVMEHVNDPAAVYAACYRWLRPGGIMSHRIDHSAHGITERWNGHYDIPPWLWRLIVGNRPFLLNRWSPSAHLAAIRDAGFRVAANTTFVVETAPSRFTESSTFPGTDRTVKTTTVVAAKPE